MGLPLIVWMNHTSCLERKKMTLFVEAGGGQSHSRTNSADFQKCPIQPRKCQTSSITS